jgi:transposase
MKSNNIIGIDIGKSAHQLYCTGGLKKRLRRSEILEFFSNYTASTIGMEACGGSHYWARELSKAGHTVKLMPPQYVKPFVKRNKNDSADAEGCWEAVQRPTMRFVPVKTAEQQASLQLHRERERLICERTKTVNQVGGFLLEFGIVLSRGINKFAANVADALEKYSERIPALTQMLVSRCVDDFLYFEKRVQQCDELIKLQLKEDPIALCLDTIAGIGPIIATALRALVPDPSQFTNGRHFAASLGLVPSQSSSGQTIRLGKMSKRGNPYLRKTLIQGAHAVINMIGNKTDPHSCWIRDIVERRGRCKAAVAIANKNARIAFAMLSGKTTKFDPIKAHDACKGEFALAA